MQYQSTVQYNISGFLRPAPTTWPSGSTCVSMVSGLPAGLSILFVFHLLHACVKCVWLSAACLSMNICCLPVYTVVVCCLSVYGYLMSACAWLSAACLSIVLCCCLYTVHYSIWLSAACLCMVICCLPVYGFLLLV